MPESDPPAPSASAATPRADYLPEIAPDVIEQDFGDEIDNIVPTRGYQMLPVVALGGSAGCIGALQRFFSATPPDSGMAFVVIIHLSAEHDSIMDEILSRATKMRVLSAENAMKVEANTVYVIPPGQFLTLTDGHLRLTPMEAERGKRVAVDLFFRTLADTHGPSATAIVLSGADGDGALGIKRIKERGGLTIAQDPDEAEHSSMPRSAIDTGMVDWVLPVDEMPARLVDYRANATRLRLPPEDGPQPAQAPAEPTDEEETALREVLAYLRTRTGRDFSYYKRSTVVRRIARRMQVNGVASVREYLLFLRTHPGEAGALQQDLLISVTNFFRDREAFEALQEELPRIFAGKTGNDVVRAWTAGCATGEEAYSVAMLLLEQAAKMEPAPAIQVFATDLAEDAIAAAREGLFPFTITADVSEERLRRFFTKEHRGYRARRELRECVLFAVHDLLKDAPFSRLDLLTCRNLLIYLTPEAQTRVFETAHFALKPEGLLFIGSSETVDDESTHWRVVNKKHRIYRQRPVARGGLVVPVGPSTVARAVDTQFQPPGGPFLQGALFSTTAAAALRRDAEAHHRRALSWEELHYKLIERFAPPSLLVTRDYDIVHMSENAGRFLHFTGGEPSVNLLHVVHPMLRVELRAALFRAAQSNLPVEVFRVPLELDGKALAADIRVAPAQDLAPDYLLVTFALREPAESASVEAQQEAEPAVRHLERELEQIKTRLRDTVEQYEAACEELKAGNEELQAMNEELRSSAEELETSREELQSVNEELSTVNQELKVKVDDLAHSNADLANLMTATGVVTIFLDRSLHILRYTPGAVALFHLIPSDISRPLTDLNHGLNYPELTADAAKVLDTLIPVKREVSDGQRWFLAHLLPYRTAEDRIVGVVLTFLDITEARGTERALRESEERMRTLADAVPQIIWGNDAEGRANYFNRRWYEFSGLTFEQSEGLGWEAIVHSDDAAASKERWERAQENGEVFDSEYRLRGRDGQYRWFIGRNVPTRDATGRVTGWFGTATDVQELKEANAALTASEEQFRRAIEDAPIPVIMHAEDGQVLQVSRTWTELTGYTAADIPTLDAWLLRAFGEGSTEIRAHVRQLFESEERLMDAEIEVRTRDGQQRRWAFSASAPGTLRDGRRFIVGMALDITERKLAEENLRESEKFTVAVLDSLPAEIAVLAQNGSIIAVNEPWRRFAAAQGNRATTQIGVGANYLDVCRAAMESGDAVAGETLHRIEALLKGEVTEFTYEYPCATPDEVRWFEMHVVRANLATGGAVVTHSDITTRRLAQEELRQSQERLGLIVENARDYAIFSLDLNRRVTSWNSGAHAILGYTPDEVIGQSADIIFTPEDRAKEVPEHEASSALAEGRAADERWHLRRDGTRFWGSGVMMPMRDADGKAIGFVKIFRDQTDELRAKETLEKNRQELWNAVQENEIARREAEAASQAKDHFLAVLSHELRTPLTPVLMATATLLRDKNLPAAAKHSLELIRRNVQLEAQFIDELLDVTRIGRGMLELAREPLDVHEAIREAMSVSMPDFEAKSQKVVVELAATKHAGEGDFTRLQQVFWNLLKNASKFSPAGGEVRVASRNEDHVIIVEVADSGIGIAPKALERIFDPFVQADESISRRFGGLGLGLALAKATVEGHGGTITAVSKGEGRGATFRVELPLTRTVGA